MKDFAGRVNVMTRSFHKKTVIIYDDHRWLLNVLFYYFKKNNNSQLNLVTFDAHDDAASCEKHSEMLLKIGVNNLREATAKQFSAFVDFDVRPDDGNWLKVACELNLIKDSCSIGIRNNFNLESVDNKYVSEVGIEHHLFTMSDDYQMEKSPQGKLGDSERTEECNGLRLFFGCQDNFNGIIGLMKPFILDFDLDYFTFTTDRDVIAWTSKFWRKKYQESSDDRQFILQLMHKAEIITICREPDYCGSIGESNKILEMLDYYFFDGQLGAIQPY